MITLEVNGKQVELEAPIPLVLYLEKLGVNPRAVAVEHNGEIVQHAKFAAVVLEEGDRVEIVRMVGGGCDARPAKGARPARAPGVL
jgi:sulfur carrier protein